MNIIAPQSIFLSGLSRSVGVTDVPLDWSAISFLFLISILEIIEIPLFSTERVCRSHFNCRLSIFFSQLANE